MRAALIILSFNNVQDTVECLRSIYRAKPAMADVIVVDNASAEGTVADLRRVFPDTEIIGLQENKGWAGGNNVGIQVALARGYDLIGLVNNDLVFCGGALDSVLHVATSMQPCLLHPAIYYYHDPGRAQIDPTQQSAPVSIQEHLYALDFAYGACLFVHLEVFSTIGLMDERFFLQLEETDFYLRAVKAGFRSLCYANARVLHKESVGFGGKRSAAKIYYMVRNSLLLNEKHARGIVGHAAGLRRFIWTLWSLADSKASLAEFLRWFCSRDDRAVAARAGIRDYALRRFGRMGNATTHSLSKRSARTRGRPSLPST